MSTQNVFTAGSNYLTNSLRNVRKRAFKTEEHGIKLREFFIKEPINFICQTGRGGYLSHPKLGTICDKPSSTIRRKLYNFFKIPRQKQKESLKK